MIDIRNLTKRYGRHTAISDVTFTALPGAVTGLLGPNGAGKSTTMRLLLGLDTPTSGSALLGGRTYRSLPMPLRTIGAQFDGSGAHRGRTAEAHLRWIALSNGIPRRRVAEVLDLVGLSGAARTRVGAFSLGMGQRLGIAAALLGEPDILVFDEPMNGLDADGIRWIRGLLRESADVGKTVLVSSHLMSEVEAVADAIVVLDEGRVLRSGATSDLVRGHANLEDAYFSWTERGSGAERGAGSSPGRTQDRA